MCHPPHTHQLGFPIRVSSLRALFIIIRNKWMQLLLLRCDKILTLSIKEQRTLTTGGNLCIIRARAHTHPKRRKIKVRYLESRIQKGKKEQKEKKKKKKNQTKDIICYWKTKKKEMPSSPEYLSMCTCKSVILPMQPEVSFLRCFFFNMIEMIL